MIAVDETQRAHVDEERRSIPTVLEQTHHVSTRRSNSQGGTGQSRSSSGRQIGIYVIRPTSA